jgi:uncharacterized protein YgiM (DUF1202 family)
MKKNRASVLFLGLMLGAAGFAPQMAISAQASGVGVAAVIGYSGDDADVESNIDLAQASELAEKITENAEETDENVTEFVAGHSSDLVMAHVGKAINVRTDPSENAALAGVLYKDCGGRVLDQKNGWTKIESGNLVGWARDDFLLFGEDAQKVAGEVGSSVIDVTANALYVRSADNTSAESMGVLTRGDQLDIIKEQDNGWIAVDFDNETGYVQADYVTTDFRIDAGETQAEIEAREKREKQKELQKNRGKVASDADTTRLLGALIYCEAGNQPYEGKVSVCAVVMNRVRSGAYPNTVHSVIYASGQFTPALNGKVARVYNSGVPDSCIQAAQAALNGDTYVGGATHFRRAGCHQGQVLGAHVFW